MNKSLWSNHIVELYFIAPYSTPVWKSGKSWMDKEGKVHCKRHKIPLPIATHEAHLAGKTLKEATKNIGIPNTDCVVIYKRYSNWRLLHGDDAYAIISWRDILLTAGAAPITRKVKGHLVYFLRKLKR